MILLWKIRLLLKTLRHSTFNSFMIRQLTLWRLVSLSPASLLLSTCAGNVESTPVPWCREAPCRLRVASAPWGWVPFVSINLLFPLIPFYRSMAATSSSFRLTTVPSFAWRLHRCDQQDSQMKSALTGGPSGLLFSCWTGECLSWPTPHKLADNLLPGLLICLPDNPRSAGTLSFPPGPIIRSPMQTPGSCSYCGRVFLYNPTMSVTTQAFMGR